MRGQVPAIAEGAVVRSAYIPVMLQRVRTPRGRSNNAPAAFINPRQPTVASKPPTGPGWAHPEGKFRGRTQI